MATQTPIFVLSSGRTGSTLLARMIGHHPELLSVSDLIEPVGEIPYFDRDRRVDGKAFFDVLKQPSFPQRTAYWRHQANAELLYLHDDDEMVSLLVSYTLPFVVGGDPMPLFREVEQAFQTRGVDSMDGHMIWFFDWLRDRFGKQLWLERTGGSLPHTRRIVELWPEARIVHNMRDPRETTISMMKGSFFRLYLELEKNPDLGRWDWDAMPPLEEMGAMLDRWVVDAVDALRSVPAGQLMDLKYEDLMQDAEATLLRFVGFVLDREPNDVDRAWAAEQAAIIRPSSLKFPGRSEDEQRRLQASVARSLSLLGYS